MQKESDSLRSNPQAKQILENKKAIEQVLKNPEAQKVLKQLQQKDSKQLQSAAKAALGGDTTALNKLFQELSGNPEAKKAMENLNDTMSKL